ncbi:nicotinamide riboside transporter PnuC [Brumimicrobium aurantiacum]|uniref:nicotinamide riboside transporter PnuC n=1 Tax=Brumimicrobium aurantiacum TaxID=1737063 RepID=UPI001402304B|nr:nicotinamide riboside transporter PnuC [Brumimicrobium aurantiacum]
MEIIDEVLEGLANTSLLEWAGVLIGTGYLILIALKNRFGWFFAMVSTAIYIYLCYISQLYIESCLQVFYFVMAIYGWITWNKGSSEERLIIRWPIKYHLLNIVASSIVTVALGYIMVIWTDQENPYLDAFSTVFSLVATYMVTQKVLENWIYWIVIDATLISLYSSRGLYLTGFHYLIYTIIAIFAFISWIRIYKAQKIESHIHRT